MIADLAEQNFGEWQGLTYEELTSRATANSIASGMRRRIRPRRAARAFLAVIERV